MTTYMGKSCSFGFPRVPFVNCRQVMYLVISLLVLRAGCGIWLYQFLIIAYLFTFHLWFVWTWAVACQNLQVTCAHNTGKIQGSTCSREDLNQHKHPHSLRVAAVHRSFVSLTSHRTPNQDSDQSSWMRRLVRVVDRRTCGSVLRPKQYNSAWSN